MKKADLFIIIAVVLIAGIGLLFMLGGNSDMPYAVVQSEGKEVLRLPLHGAEQKHIIEVAGGYNTVVIGGGRAWVEEADCPDRLCVKQGEIDRASQSAVCLPHRMVLRIEGAEDTLDGIAN